MYTELANRKSIWKKINEQKMLLLFIVPAVVSVIVFSYVPMVGIVMAFQEYDLVGGYLHSPWVGLEHFWKFLTNQEFWDSMINTVGINIVAILIGFPAPIVFALLINEIVNLKFKKIVQTITYFPHFLSWVVVALLFYRLLDVNTGIVNEMLAFIGMDKIAFFREPAYIWFVIVFAVVWKELGWNSIIYIGCIAGIDQSQYESAMVDGANRLQRAIFITLPGMMPTIILLLILTAGSITSINFSVMGTMTPTFEEIYNFSNPLVIERSMVVDLYAYRSGLMYQEYSYAAAIGLTLSILSFTSVWIANKISKKINGYGIF